MRKIVLSLAALATLGVAGGDIKEEVIETKVVEEPAVDMGKINGQIRLFSISRAYEFSAAVDYTRKATAIGGFLKYELPSFHGLSFGAGFYTTNGFNLDAPKTDYTVVDPTLLGDNNDNYTILGEAYLQYKFGNTLIKVGRQRIDTPMAGSDDARMLPNLFEGALIANSDLPDTSLVLAHITKFAQGTFGRVYNGGILSATSGYSAVDSRTRAGEFVKMGDYAIGADTDGVSVLGITYTGIPNLKLQVWDYYAHDILNVLYAQADYSVDLGGVKVFAGAQIIKEDSVGDNLLSLLGGNGEIDSLYWGLQGGFSWNGLTLSGAYSQLGENAATDAAYANAIISPWGGMPAFTQGMVTRHQFLAGTEAAKVALKYDFNNLMGVNLSAAAYYTDYTMDANNGYTFGDASESGLDVIYYPTKNLQLRFRANFAEDFNVNATGATTSWDEYRFIVNYNF
ncbi:MAG: OprD family outer membrane porin [Campylobacterales bacterium]|nr:OprD family outer membrane porin [Campylobacterales bacterium]